MIRKHNGIISVVRRKLITSDESFLTRAPMTPRDVRRRYSKGRDFDVVLRKGYRKRGMCAENHVSDVIAEDPKASLTAEEETTSLVV